MTTDHITAFDEILNSAPPPRVNGVRVISAKHHDDNEEEPTMPKGIYDRKPKGPKADAPKKRNGRAPKPAAPPVAKKSRGQYSDVLAELHAKREQIDAAIAAIENLG